MKKYIRKYKWQLIWVIGVIVMMFTHINWHYAAVITIGLVAFLIIDSQDIKKIVMNNKGVAIEKQEEKIDKALVEYDEFKKTIYPLLEMLMANIVFDGYLGVYSRPANLVDFLNRIENLPLGVNTDPQIEKLITAVKVKVIDAYSAELISIRQNNNLDTGIDDCISVKYPKFDGEHYLNGDDVIIDFEKLKESGEDFSDDFEKQRYLNVIKQLKEFYTQNNF